MLPLMGAHTARVAVVLALLSLHDRSATSGVRLLRRRLLEEVQYEINEPRAPGHLHEHDQCNDAPFPAVPRGLSNRPDRHMPPSMSQ
jgi:hypothetical protein